MLRWLKKVDSNSESYGNNNESVGIGLPSPSSSIGRTLNSVVDREYQTSPSISGKRKRGSYSAYSPEMKAKMARYAIDNGNTKAAKYFSTKLGRDVNESTIRSFKSAYNLKKVTAGVDVVTTISSPKRGRPTKLTAELDSQIQQYILELRNAGGVVNTSIVMSIACGVIKENDRFMLKENGGGIDIGRPWARSLMERMKFTKRKGTKGVKHLPDDFNNIKNEFVDRIHSLIEKNDIPDELIINWDQTGVNMVPIGQWTMAQKGDKQVKIMGSDDKRQITALLSSTRSGKFLPPQLIYKGKTDKCHPLVEFLADWNITHSETHWSNEDTMLQFADKIIIPYIESVRENLPIEKCDQPAIAIFDVFKAHRSELLLDKLKQNNIRIVFIPPSCTDQLQPLDAIPNKLFKDELKSTFQMYYSDIVADKIKHKQPVHGIDLRTSVIKPIHGKWMMRAHQKLCDNPEVIKTAFEQCGI